MKQDDKLLKEAEQKIAALEHELSLYQQDGPIGFYYELNRWVNSTREYMKGKTVNSMISAEKDDKTLDRTLVLIKSARENIEALHSMKTMFDSITGNEEEDKTKRVSFIDRLAIKRTV